jgi:hypothetical protein
MLHQTITWTALPNGLTEDGTRLRLSVFVSPRLQSTDTTAVQSLSKFPDFLQWPQKMAAATFGVRFDDGTAIPATVVGPAQDPEAPADELWRAVFNTGTEVKPYVEPVVLDRPLRSFSVRNVREHVETVYQTLATETPQLKPFTRPDDPAVKPAVDALRTIALPGAQRAQVAQSLDRQLSTLQYKALLNTTVQPKRAALLPGGAARTFSSPFLARTNAPVATVPQAAVDFVQVSSFHETQTIARQVGREVGLLHPKIPAPDFHEICTHLGQYPEMLKRLRLVIELEVPLTPALMSAQWVRVVPSWQPSIANANIAPRTACRITADSFVTRSKSTGDGAESADGMLRLDDPGAFDVGQMDVDAAAIQAVDYANKVTQWVVSTSMALARGDAVPPVPTVDTSPPTLRTAGIWVARLNRALQLATQTLPLVKARNDVLKAAAARAIAGPASAQRVAAALTTTEDSQLEMYAEDLVRGWRVDVWDADAGQWYSLCRRLGTYQFRNASQGVNRTLDNIEDEGWVTSGARDSLDATQSLHLHEIILRWEGWSLVAPRPDKPFPEESAPASPFAHFGMDAAFVPVRGSLPRLRFGRRYRLRARLVDLAGNGLPWSTTGLDHASEMLTYSRHEPVDAPAVVPREDISNAPGETVETVVLRSLNPAGGTPDQPTDAAAAQTADRARNTAVASRHVAAPKTSVQMAELHGMFDGATGMKGDAATFQMLLDHDQPLQEFYNGDHLPLTYLPDPLATTVAVKVRFPLSATPDKVTSMKVPMPGTWPDIQTFRLDVYEPAGAEVPAFDEATRVLRIPLPKGETAEVTLSCALEAQRVPEMAVWQMSVDRVTLPSMAKLALPPQEKQEARVRLARPAQMGLEARRVGLDAAAAAKLVNLGQVASDGANQLLTPSRTVTILHAVQQPLGVPKIELLAATRDFGETFASLVGRIPVDGKSTAKVDVTATWTDPIDDLSRPGPEPYSSSQHVWELPVQSTDKLLLIALPAAQILTPVVPLIPATVGGLRAPAAVTPPVTAPAPGPVAPGPVAPAPERRLQPGLLRAPLQATPQATQGAAPAGGAEVAQVRSLQVQPGPLTAAAGTGAALKPGVGQTSAIRQLSNQPLHRDVDRTKLFDPSLLEALPAGIPRRHEIGDTKYHKITYTAITTSRFRKCFDFTDEDIASGRTPVTRVSQPVALDILSTARPAAPKVLYVIPTFGWERQETGAGMTSKRTGGGLRVYLERPWYSSGDGELLGVVIPWPKEPVDLRHKSTYKWMDTLRSYVTQMGADPIWRTRATTAWPVPDDFKAKTTWEGDLVLDELSQEPDGIMRMRTDCRVAVVGHEVHYDPDRQLWYCDIEIDPKDSYYPFVRLALARYQPMSVKRGGMDVKLSRVVMADFAQLAPERLATVNYPNATTASVVVTGVDYIGSNRISGSSRMEVSVDTADAALGGEFRWRPEPTPAVVLTSQRPADNTMRWIWQGTITLPYARGSRPMRLVLREYEAFEGEATAQQLTAVAMVAPAPPVSRLVYADTFEI